MKDFIKSLEHQIFQIFNILVIYLKQIYKIKQNITHIR